jgi:hypothetical protein
VTKQQKQLALAGGGLLVLLLLYRLYAARKASAAGPAADPSTGGTTSNPDSAGYADLAGQQQSDVAALSNAEQSDYGTVNGALAGLQQQVDGLTLGNGQPGLGMAPAPGAQAPSHFGAIEQQLAGLTAAVTAQDHAAIVAQAAGYRAPTYAAPKRPSKVSKHGHHVKGAKKEPHRTGHGKPGHPGHRSGVHPAQHPVAHSAHHQAAHHGRSAGHSVAASSHGRKPGVRGPGRAPDTYRATVPHITHVAPQAGTPSAGAAAPRRTHHAPAPVHHVPHPAPATHHPKKGKR